LKNKLPRVKNPRFLPIISFGFGFLSERSRRYVSSSLHPRIDDPQFSRSENKSSGQTLIEIIIAIAVGTLIVSATLGLITRANKNANFAKAQSQANKLANGGMEIILNIRAVNDCDAVIPYGTFPEVCGSAPSLGSWDELYTIQIDNSCAVLAECSDDYGHIFRLHSPGSPECASTFSWCIHGHTDLGVKEEITLDNLTFTREVFIADSDTGPPPPTSQGHSKCNDDLAVTDDFKNIKQITVKVFWVDSTGTHDTKLVNCIARL